MAGYICALAISLFAVITGIIFMIYPLYHKHVCNEPATANVIDIHMEWRDDHWHSYPVFQYQADGKTVIIQHNVSPTSYEIGDQVELRYNQKNPRAVLHSPCVRWELDVPVWRVVFLFDRVWLYRTDHKGMAASADFENLN